MLKRIAALMLLLTLTLGLTACSGGTRLPQYGGSTVLFGFTPGMTLTDLPREVIHAADSHTGIAVRDLFDRQHAAASYFAGVRADRAGIRRVELTEDAVTLPGFESGVMSTLYFAYANNGRRVVRQDEAAVLYAADFLFPGGEETMAILRAHAEDLFGAPLIDEGSPDGFFGELNPAFTGSMTLAQLQQYRSEPLIVTLWQPDAETVVLLQRLPAVGSEEPVRLLLAWPVGEALITEGWQMEGINDFSN